MKGVGIKILGYSCCFSEEGGDGEYIYTKDPRIRTEASLLIEKKR
jgi:hypothetical protein